MAKRKLRALIVYDGECWYARGIRVVEHDLDKDEKVYRCDVPIGVRFGTAEAALTVAKQWLGLEGS